jgi:hypothetical protein
VKGVQAPQSELEHVLVVLEWYTLIKERGRFLAKPQNF